jgi:hypothetical protein
MKNITLPEPFGLKFTEWGAIVAEQLAQYGISAPSNDDSWKTWVCALFYVPELASMNIPGGDGFDDWSLWAQQFIGAVR